MKLEEALAILDEGRADDASFVADVLVDINKLAKGRSRSTYMGDAQSIFSFLQFDGKEAQAVVEFLEKLLGRIRDKK